MRLIPGGGFRVVVRLALPVSSIMEEPLQQSAVLPGPVRFFLSVGCWPGVG